MFETVAIPLWMVWVAGVLALIAFLDRLLVPSVRWLLRGRVNRVIDDVNERLQIGIRPFTLTRRQVLLDRLCCDVKVAEAVEQEAAASGVPRRVIMERVQAYAHEIVPAFNAYMYFRLGYWLARKIAVNLYRVRIGHANERALSSIDPSSSIVFVMNHRSNMDYVLVSFLVASHSALSYAVGEWARIWPLQSLIRAMGAYFVRRNSGDALYRRVLERYVAMAVEGGVTQAMFPEGGLSRDGKLRAPRLGLLDYMLRGFDPQGARDVVFVPVGINYDRVLEDRNLLRMLDADAPRVGKLASLNATLGFIARNIRLRLQGRWYRFGYACVNFGEPVSLRAFLAEQSADPRRMPKPQRFELVSSLAGRLMAETGRVIPVLPVSLIAQVMLGAEDKAATVSGDKGMSHLQLKVRVSELMQTLRGRGAHVYLPRDNEDYVIEVGLRMLILRRVLLEQDGRLRIAQGQHGLLAYYAGAIEHL